MKVLLFNGSPRVNGCTHAALTEIATVLNGEGIDTEILDVGPRNVRDCIACGGCKGKGKCVFDDDPVNEYIEKAKSADGFIFGTPVYYSHPTGRIMSVMDRLFYAGKAYFTLKPGAVIASARRGGSNEAMDALVKHLTIAQMPVVSSTYWNMVFGNTPDEIRQDAEGMQTMRNLGKNMAWILKCIQAGKDAGINPPDNGSAIRTNFIR